MEPVGGLAKIEQVAQGAHLETVLKGPLETRVPGSNVHRNGGWELKQFASGILHLRSLCIFGSKARDGARRIVTQPTWLAALGRHDSVGQTRAGDGNAWE